MSQELAQATEIGDSAGARSFAGFPSSSKGGSREKSCRPARGREDAIGVGVLEVSEDDISSPWPPATHLSMGWGAPHPSEGSFVQRMAAKRLEDPKTTREGDVIAGPVAGAVQRPSTACPHHGAGDTGPMLEVRHRRFYPHEGMKTLVAISQWGETAAWRLYRGFWTWASLQMSHHGPQTPSDSCAKSPHPRLQLRWGGQSTDPMGQQCPRAVTGDTGWQQGWHPAEPEKPGRLFCLVLLKCVMFWTDEEISTLKFSGKALFLPPGPALCPSQQEGGPQWQ